MISPNTPSRFRFSLGLQIGLGFAVGAAVTIAVGLVGINGIARISATIEKTSIANQAFVQMNDIHQSFADFLAVKSNANADATINKIGSVVEAIRQIDTGGTNFQITQSALDDLKKQIAAILKSETDINTAMAATDSSIDAMTAIIATVSGQADALSSEAAALEQAGMKRLDAIDAALMQINQVNTAALKSSGYIQKYIPSGDEKALGSITLVAGALDGVLADLRDASLDPSITKTATQIGKSLAGALDDMAKLPDLYVNAHQPDSTAEAQTIFKNVTDVLIIRFDGIVTRSEGMRAIVTQLRKAALEGMLQGGKKRAAAKDIAALGQIAADARSDLLIATKAFFAKAGRGDPAPVVALIDRMDDVAKRTDAAGATKALGDILTRFRASFIAAGKVLGSQETIRKQAEAAANTAVKTISDIAAQILSQSNAITAFQQMVALATLGFGCIVTIIFAITTARSVRNPINALTRIMARLAEGDTSVKAPGLGRRDEIGEMSRTVEVFRDAAIEKRRLEAEAMSDVSERAERQARIEAMIASFRADIERLLAGVAAQARKMEDAARRLNDVSGQSQRQALSASGATSDASENVATVAASAEELSASIQEISARVQRTVAVVGTASDQASHSNDRIVGLAQSAARIGDVVKLIRSIADQTNLLALNATIEAARAGDAGRGFAVVAAEVKQLADQTAKATQEIANQVDGIQTATREAVDSIGEITKSMHTVNDFTASIANAVAEQGSATSEISRNAQGASRGTQVVASTMDTLVKTSEDANQAANDVNVVAREVIDANTELTRTIDHFLETVAVA